MQKIVIDIDINITCFSQFFINYIVWVVVGLDSIMRATSNVIPRMNLIINMALNIFTVFYTTGVVRSAAMEDELRSIERNHTWDLVQLPKNKKPISVKWVFKLKLDPEGRIVKHKARLVARGFLQKQGVDYTEIFAPVARHETVNFE